MIVQNFRAKPRTAMRDHPEPSFDEFLAAVATARVVMGPRMNVQAPPNLSDPHYPRLLDAGINDWGGISPLSKDYVNPEAPWPHIERLGEQCARAGFELRERLAIYPEYINDEWLDPAVATKVRAIWDRPVGGQS